MCTFFQVWTLQDFQVAGTTNCVVSSSELTTSDVKDHKETSTILKFDANKDLEVVLYRNDLALMIKSVAVNLKKGHNKVEFRGIPSRINQDSVSIIPKSSQSTVLGYRVSDGVLLVDVESTEDIKTELNLAYLCSGISWKPSCIIDVMYENKSTEVVVKAIIKSQDDTKFENILVHFNNFAPCIDQLKDIQPALARDFSGSAFVLNRKISIENGSSTVFLKRSICCNPIREYIILVPTDINVDSITNELKSFNLLVIKNAKDVCCFENISSDDIIVFCTKKDSKNFLGKQTFGIKNDELIFKIDQTNDVSAVLQQIVLRKLSTVATAYMQKVIVTNNNKENVRARVINETKGIISAETSNQTDKNQDNNSMMCFDVKHGENIEVRYRVEK